METRHNGGPLPPAERRAQRIGRVRLALCAVFLIVMLAVNEFGASTFDMPFQVPDPYISYPSRSQQCPSTTCLAPVAVAPMILIVLVAAFELYSAKQSKVHRSLAWDRFFRNASAYIYTILVTVIVTEYLKHAVGELRPDFLDRCKPKTTPCAMGTCECTGDSASIAEGRLSFPSGHSSVAFASMSFLSAMMARLFHVGPGTLHIESPYEITYSSDNSSPLPFAIHRMQRQDCFVFMIFIALVSIVYVKRSSQSPPTGSCASASSSTATLTKYGLLGGAQCGVPGSLVSPMFAIKTARSLGRCRLCPSAASSFAYCAMAFLTALQAEFNSLATVRWLLSIWPMLVATWVGVTRVEDFRHHPVDVFIGAVIGITVAVMMVALFFGSSAWYLVPKIPLLGRAHPLRRTPNSSTQSASHLSDETTDVEMG